MTKDDEIEAVLRGRMNDIGRLLEQALSRDDETRRGFFLAVFPFAEEGRFNYISNAERKDIIVLLKEMLARFEGQPEMRGRA